MGKSWNTLAVFNKSFLLILIHLILVLISFLFLKQTPITVKNEKIQIYQELEWSELVNIFSQNNEYIVLQKIKPKWDTFGFELNLLGSYKPFHQWLIQLHEKYPYLQWSHIRLSQKSKLLIEMEGFGHV